MAEDAQKAAREFIRELWSLQGVSYAVVATRYYNRISTLGWRSLAWDDSLIALATLVYTAESVMAHLVVAYWKGLANNAMTDEQRRLLDPSSEEWWLRVNGSKTHVVGLLLYTTLLWLLKACWLVYYARLTNGVHKKRRMIKWGTIFVMVMNTLTDFYLMAIPIPVIWVSHLPTRKKLALIIMFGGGFLEMAFGILRCVSILTIGDIDPAQSGYWSVRESFVSFVLTNLPLIYPLFGGALEKGRGRSQSKASRSKDSRGYRLDSLSRPKEQSHQHPLSIPNETTWGSKEQIVVVPEQVTASSGDEVPLKLHENQSVSSSEQLEADPVSRRTLRKGLTRQSRSGQDADGIVVTKEYTVTDAGPATRHISELPRF
ncbi:hypothetical protein DL766_001690 [Monosporascus sp. MC13-8B]|uniref:Rhodopsin domain-containing protein n=1 Tax=Monosporascus cannonballus TaxID=155416 RepID=A0ABY0H330_9PEZI|nr:hypothetical protein DL763_008422 [Monosporascus cannonballus]RYO83551.1 hypothetical protein DL762_006075 [Monosporascus cannonballus]RYP37016.1 hypothetical protein DL766_001690 [Monosporascus sp. MC13-8B]